MILGIRRYFAQRVKQAEDPVHALRLATAALFIEMTRADFTVEEREVHKVTEAVQRVLDLSTAETQELVALAEEEAKESVSLFEFTRLVNEGFSPHKKREIIELLWQVAYADARLDKHEEYLVRKVARLIHVPHRDFISARRRARDAVQSDDR